MMLLVMFGLSMLISKAWGQLVGRFQGVKCPQAEAINAKSYKSFESGTIKLVCVHQSNFSGNQQRAALVSGLLELRRSTQA